jgi:transcriptional regulator with XRE-family HTH domain
MAPSKRTDEESAAIERLGKRIRAKRKAKGMKVEELAYRAGISFEHMHALERGEHKPRDYTLRRVARALGVTVESLEQDNGKGNGGRRK